MWCVVSVLNDPQEFNSVTESKTRLSRREQEVMDIIYARGLATAAEVREAMPDPPTDAAVRTTLRALLEKGHVKTARDGRRYVYSPTVPRAAARRSELEHVLNTFFGGSTESAMTTLLELGGNELSEEERNRLKLLIDEAVEEGR
ncbi:MAG: BlaI/MecI/CopY family transcriptional regulator [Acidobacteria bacterium]|nr:BlaI/MecI/CopY family transcriptional regulator [Acidobacteriota bacterium]